MIQRLNISSIADLLEADPKSHWSRMGALVMAEFLDEYMPADDEIDLTAINTEFREYLSCTEWAEDTHETTASAADSMWGGCWLDYNDLDREIKIAEYIRTKRADLMFIEMDTGIIIQQSP